jgi:hypothetical protein
VAGNGVGRRNPLSSLEQPAQPKRQKRRFQKPQKHLEGSTFDSKSLSTSRRHLRRQTGDILVHSLSRFRDIEVRQRVEKKFNVKPLLVNLYNEVKSQINMSYKSKAFTLFLETDD